MLVFLSCKPDQAKKMLRALATREGFAERPRDAQVLPTLVDAWKAIGQPAPAREALDEALAKCPDESRLWEARLVFTRQEDARAVVDRWLEAMPDHPAALEVLEAAPAPPQLPVTAISRPGSRPLSVSAST